MTVVQELTALDRAVDAGVQRLLELQSPEGWWCGELESNATMVAEHLFWLHFMGLRDPATDRKLANELLIRRRDDGTWSNWFEGPADLSTTIESYVALKMAGVDAGRETLDYIRAQGGIPRARVFTKCFLALLGQWPWQRVSPVVPEIVLLPPWSPFSIYNLACWARQTVVPLSVVMALRATRPAAVDLSEIGARPGATKPAARLGPLRRRAIAEAERWVRARQEADGGWGGIQPPWVWSILMLASLGYGFEDEQLRRAVEGWGGFLIDEGDRMRPEACQSPTWDTGLALLGLEACGVTADHPQVAKAGEWLLGEEIHVKGDWSVRVPDLDPGGWAFEYENDSYPDVDDVAVICLALRELGMGEHAVARGLAWMEGMQCSNGGWGAFDVDNDSEWLYRIPFFDFGAVIDPPSEDVAGHAVEAFAPYPHYAETTSRGLDYLLREQQDDGSWWGRWGVNHVYGTAAVLPALEAAGIGYGHPSMRRAVGWLDSVQAENGGFGEDIRSYHEPEWRGRGVPTASQTAWGLLSYVAAGEADRASARRAAEHLCATQLENGDWSERHFTGTGFPTDFMIRYHLYRLHFPLMALGRLRERLNR
ncbi:MAG TPA: squalene--hopene cyclase [Gaiellaceae bacterium]|nr:squalene--hopene cyclase [Gaiellaceae bacterium]